jgi:hypothetical protein
MKVKLGRIVEFRTPHQAVIDPELIAAIPLALTEQPDAHAGKVQMATD